MHEQPDTQLEWEFRLPPAPIAAAPADASAEVMVELRGVTKSFGQVTAVDHVDLAIRKGEFLTLLGPSGCGKTTLLRLLAGFEIPTSGQILIEGQDVSNIPTPNSNGNSVCRPRRSPRPRPTSRPRSWSSCAVSPRASDR